MKPTRDYSDDPERDDETRKINSLETPAIVAEPTVLAEPMNLTEPITSQNLTEPILSLSEPRTGNLTETLEPQEELEDEG